MKYLSIKNTPDGLRLARCLIMSNITHKDLAVSDTNLIGVSKSTFVWEHFDSNSRWVAEWEEIYIPLDTIKLDPFAAMREGVSILIRGRGVVRIIGSEINTTSSHMYFKCRSDYCKYDVFVYPLDLTLDLTAIERGELDGVSIVEVEE
jgi:hypothetical protein